MTTIITRIIISHNTPPYYIQEVSPPVDENQDIDAYCVTLYHKNEVCPDEFRVYSSWPQVEEEISIKNKRVIITSDLLEKLNARIQPFRYKMCTVYVRDIDYNINYFLEQQEKMIAKLLTLNATTSFLIQSITDVSEENSTVPLRKIVFFLGPAANLDEMKTYIGLLQISRELVPESERNGQNKENTQQSKNGSNVER